VLKIIFLPIRIFLFSLVVLLLGNLIVVKNYTLSDHVRNIIVKTRLDRAFEKATGMQNLVSTNDSIRINQSSADRKSNLVQTIEKITEQDRQELKSLLNDKKK